MQMKRLLPIVLGFVLLSVTTTSAFADTPFAEGSVMVDDRNAVTTLRGEARAWVDGHWITDRADLKLQVK